jgi:ATP-binding cassette subfamily B protein RaxB
VVLEKLLDGGEALIVDPALGRMRVSRAQLSECLTGVALEVSRAANFSPIRSRGRSPLKQVLGSPGALGRKIVALFASILALEAANLMLPRLFRVLVDTPDARLAMRFSAGAAALILTVFLLTVIRGALLARATSLTLAPAAGSLFRHLLSLPYRFFEARHPGEVVSRFQSLAAAQRLLAVRTLEAGLDAVLCVVLAALLWQIQPLLGVCILAAMSLAGLVHLVAEWRLRQLSLLTLRLESEQHTELVECVRGIQTVQVGNLQAARLLRFDAALRGAISARGKEQLAALGLTAIQRAVFAFAYLGIVLLLASRATRFSGGEQLMILAYAAQALFRGERAITALEDFRHLAAHSERLSDITLSRPVESDSLPASRDATRAIDIEVRDLWFRFTPHDPWVFKGLNLKVVAGKSTVITGPSGCGKSTLVKLMLGLLSPVRGQILINGMPIEMFGINRLRSLSATVMQDDRLFSGSLMENIASFASNVDAERVRQACRLAEIDEEIELMPMKYHTVIAGGSVGLSGGQRQRLMIARALYLQPSLLVMDEATSHLDGDRERTISKRVSEIGITRILIAHRRETIDTADQCVRLSS